MRFILGLVVLLFIMNCKREEQIIAQQFNSVEIETILEDSLLNVRALEIKSNGNGIFATANGKLGTIDKKENKGNYLRSIKYDTIIPNFRSVATTSNADFALSIASPALLFRINAQGVTLVYKEEGEQVFYDAMAFWNDKDGLAIGDSMDGCLSIIITKDGGNSWKKLACDMLPKAKVGEGAFAASNTNIKLNGDKAWVATTAGRIFYSEDKGLSWQVFETPIIKEAETEGIYSIDFYDELTGYAIGGDYTKPSDSSANKIRTNDGGKTWELAAKDQSPGYRSCVQYIPNRNGKELVAVGFRGIDYSNDAGSNWKHLSDEGFYTIRFLNDSIAYAAGNGSISKLTFKE